MDTGISSQTGHGRTHSKRDIQGTVSDRIVVSKQLIIEHGIERALLLARNQQIRRVEVHFGEYVHHLRR